MKYPEKLQRCIRRANSRLCVGLDPRIEKSTLAELREFLLRAIGETAEFAAAFKPNSAYFEALGVAGYKLLEEVIAKIPDEVIIILDCKRGDIAETQRHYVRAYFENWNVDAVTLSPYMGFDSLEPFLRDESKAAYALALTSNPGAADLQMLKVAEAQHSDVAGASRSIVAGASCSCNPDGGPAQAKVQEKAQEQDAPATFLFEQVLKYSERAKTCPGTLGFVFGLTNLTEAVLDKIPAAPLLIPGLGAQGGDPAALKKINPGALPLVNVSRGVLYGDVAPTLAARAKHYQGMINAIIGGDG